MPLYEYKCKKCGHRFEQIQTYSAQDAKECPVCQGEVERLISAPAAHFKGSGFYSTDYAAKPAPSGNSKDGQATASDGSSKGSDKGGTDKGSGDKGSAAKTESTPAAPSSSSKSE
jgi:putative FmdB family regulatory protein